MTPSQIALRARKNNPDYHALLAEFEEWAYNDDMLDSTLMLLRADGFKIIGDVDDNRNDIIKIYAT